MTQDEIIKLARQAGFHDGLFSNESFKHHLAAFAYFVAAKEREACAKACENSVEYAGETLAEKIRAREKGTGINLTLSIKCVTM